MTTVLVTGSAGFLGSTVTRTLAKREGWTIRAGYRAGGHLPPEGEGIQPVSADVLDRAALAKACEGVDAVVHCAIGDRKVTVEGTRILLAAAKAAGVRRVVHVSTIAVYGPAEGDVTEEVPLVGPVGADYSAVKSAAEAVCREAVSSGQDVVILRPSIIYGPGSDLGVTALVKRLASGRWGTFGSGGMGVCALIHARDMAGACAAAVENAFGPTPVAPGSVYTIAGQDSPTWNAYFTALNTALGLPPLREISPLALTVRLALGLPLKALGKVLPKTREMTGQFLMGVPALSEIALFKRKAIYRPDKATRELGWTGTIGMEDGLAESAVWVKDAGILPARARWGIGIAFVGGGFVADLYMQTLGDHPELTLVGVHDRDPKRLKAFTEHHGLKAYDSLESLLVDPKVAIVVNLTNPRNHVEISRAALEAGKHVYSEKPLAMTLEEAKALASLARDKGLLLAAAPCNHLSESIQTLAQALGKGWLGRALLVQAEMDDGMIPALDHGHWRSISGAPWPSRDEFEVGCTMEHAGYQIGPLIHLFGPVRKVTSLNACRLPDKGKDVGVSVLSPDLSIGLLEFDDGVVARLTNSILAPQDRSLRVVGEAATAWVHDVWEYDAPVRIAPVGASVKHKVVRKIEKALNRWVPGLMLGRALASVRPVVATRPKGGGHLMDFSRGIVALAEHLNGGPNQVPTDMALHVTEVVLALQMPPGTAMPLTMTTTVDRQLSRG
ncbi:MAG: NAD-dependent epimerase/dehydratase family protein [Rhodospirillum sp.]|nr:NAD-dependent epimerase/dehydratase family protein [Rhodospirillum sp.]MCF8488112.1 NAD-dependent epimerase/dehydratase family protein [Rhodospirillum sp.]MCF8501285.1 NAD-dependent epimerase/dehydratase family protein [Rhodospirillum sp.]